MKHKIDKWENFCDDKKASSKLIRERQMTDDCRQTAKFLKKYRTTLFTEYVLTKIPLIGLVIRLFVDSPPSEGAGAEQSRDHHNITE